MSTTIGAGTWLRVLREVATPRDQLVCFPPAGASVHAYRDLARRFGPGIAVAAVQYPGRQDRLGEQPVPDIAILAEHVAGEILSQGSVERLALFGHSMGATVAFETARRLERAGQSVTRLFVSGRIAPPVHHTGRLHLGSDAALIGDLERLANDPATVSILRDEPSLAELVLPAVRADYQAVETYVYQEGSPLRCPISALVSTEDPTVTEAQTRDWSEHTAAEFDLRTFPGRHFYLEEKGRAVADFVTRQLG
ncbi:thioesterase [Nocardia panacis]|uniref:Thioesterase TesA n=1 Tax=Nocardia panacis TaxID=2340916 RepID=A0A3A4KUB4_9NOCA|nr:alpha/beta fold hydrolase [Nocardia panacis]RJO73464.1 thioesterase [Nocardia panacis]